MPRPTDSPDVAASKTLAYILRHGAEKEGLAIRSDGFLRLADVLARPKMKGVDEKMVLRLVKENAKQRFELFWGYDPSPPRPKPKFRQGGTKSGKGKRGGRDGERGDAVAAVGASSKVVRDLGVIHRSQARSEMKTDVDAAEIDNVRVTMAMSSISSTNSSPCTLSAIQSTSNQPSEPIYVELPLVSVPIPDAASTPSISSPQLDSCLSTSESTSTPTPAPEWFIRATQGHSIQLESTSHLEPVLDDPDGRKRAGLLVHGTRWELWDILKEQGLSRMARQHIHLAPSLTGPITPRLNSSLFIYLSLPKMLSAIPPIPVYTSLNGVVLTPGDETGHVGKQFWEKAVKVEKGGKRVVVWEDGQEVEREEEVEVLEHILALGEGKGEEKRL